MIENHRDEELCRRWDALADEDHTHHLTVQEYFHYKNKWWLHSNKQGSNTIPLRNRSDFCLLRNDYNKKLEENHMCLLTLTSANNGRHKVHLLHGGIGKAPSGLLTIQKVKEEASKVLNKRGDPLLIVFWREPSNMIFRNSIYFVSVGVTDGRCKDNTANDPFSRCKSVQQFGHR